MCPEKIRSRLKVYPKYVVCDCECHTSSDGRTGLASRTTRSRKTLHLRRHAGKTGLRVKLLRRFVFRILNRGDSLTQMRSGHKHILLFSFFWKSLSQQMTKWQLKVPLAGMDSLFVLQANQRFLPWKGKEKMQFFPDLMPSVGAVVDAVFVNASFRTDSSAL